MKKSFVAFLMFALSTLVVVMGTGVTLVYCSHTGMFSWCTHMKMKDCDGQKQKPCTSVFQVKISNQQTAQVSQVSLDAPIQILMPQMVSLTSLIPPTKLFPRWLVADSMQDSGPPRSYLRLLTTLLI